MSGKAVLISINSKWCWKIVLGEKTIEIRKTKPNLKPPFKCYIYQTLPKYGDWNESDGHVIGEFICNNVSEYKYPSSYNEKEIAGFFKKFAKLTVSEVWNYGKGKPLYGWHISNLVIYDQPKPLSEFKRWNRTEENAPCAHVSSLYPPCRECKECGLKRAPQSWCYVED